MTLAAGVALALVLAATPKARTRDDVIKDALAAIEAYSGDLSELKRAHAQLVELVDLQPRDAMAHVLLSRIEVNFACQGSRTCDEDRLRDAKDLADRAIALDPALPEAHTQKGWVFYRQRDWYGAESGANRALALRPNDWRAHALLADVAAEQKRWKQAAELGRIALSEATTPPAKASVHGTLAFVYVNLPDRKAAEASYRAQVDLAPKRAWPKGNLASFLLDQGRVDEAIVLFKAALALMDYGAARDGLRRAYDRKAAEAEKAGNLKAADRFRALAVDAVAPPREADDSDPLAFSMKKVMDVLDASPRKYTITAAKDEPAAWLEENAQLAWPRAKEAVAVVDAQQRQPGLPGLPAYDALAAYRATEYQNTRAAALGAFDQKDFTLALTHFTQLTSSFPDDHFAWYWRGNAEAQLGRTKGALESWVRALAMRPDDDAMRRAIAPHLARAGFVAKERTLLPRARVTPIDGGFELVSSPRAHWIAWSTCKAAWKGEPEFRKAQTGREDHVFTAREDRQCLAALGGVYAHDRTARKVPKEPALDQLVDAAAAQLLGGYQAWEVASRIEPNVYVALTPQGRKDVEAYVRRFVLVPK